MDQVSRFAVPFFFEISGYFWGLKIRKSDSPLPASIFMARRILFLFLVWSVIYLFPFNYILDVGNGPLQLVKAVYWHVSELAADPVRLVMEGTKVHLWFLVGLLCSIAICATLVRYNKIRMLVILAVALYIAGLLAKAYSVTPIGIHTGFNTRNGPFFGTIFFVSGYLLSGLRPNERWFGWGMAILGFGYVMHFSEIYFLCDHYHEKPFQDYVVGTYFMGMGATMASLSNHPFLRLAIFGSLGRMTLGIYAIHFAFVDMLRQSARSGVLPWWTYFVSVLVLSIAAAMILSKNRFTRKLVI